MLKVVGVLALAALSVWAFLDVAQTPRARLHGPRLAWFAACLVPLFGPAAWLLLGSSRDRGGPGPGRRPVAPDDDPDFLRGLDDRHRQPPDDVV